MTIDSEDDIQGLQKIGRICANTMQHMAAHLEPGITTRELDDLGRVYLERHGARSAPELTYDYPGATCISVNHCVAHGIPDDTVIQSGDMINIDVSAELDGYFGDTGASFLAPPNSHEQHSVCKAAKKARNKAIQSLRPGMRLNEIGKIIEKTARKHNMRVVRNLSSHGVGRALHEDPGQILPYFEKSETRKLDNGAVITIEPFLSTGADMVFDGDDGWSLYTDEGVYTAQYEHTVIVTRNGPIITTHADYQKAI